MERKLPAFKTDEEAARFLDRENLSDYINVENNRVALRYSEALGDVVPAGSTSVWAQYTIGLAEGGRDALAAALKAEHNYRHTALMHTRNIRNMTKMAKAMNTTLFVVNAPCGAALGADAPSYLSFSIATPTGEGVTTPLTFTRERQIVIGGGDLRFI